jgi:hypothetical protein
LGQGKNMNVPLDPISTSSSSSSSSSCPAAMRPLGRPCTIDYVAPRCSFLREADQVSGLSSCPIFNIVHPDPLRSPTFSVAFHCALQDDVC